MATKIFITGKEVADCARRNGAEVRECPNERVYIGNPTNHKAVIIPAGNLKPHAAFHIGVIVRWVLIIMGLIAAVSAHTGGLAGLIK